MYKRCYTRNDSSLLSLLYSNLAVDHRSVKHIISRIISKLAHLIFSRSLLQTFSLLLLLSSLLLFRGFDHLGRLQFVIIYYMFIYFGLGKFKTDICVSNRQCLVSQHTNNSNARVNK